MDKPDFGIGKYYATKWTPERLAYVRHLAERGLSAAQIAQEIFGSVAKGERIAVACRKNGIKLNGRPGRRPHVARPVVIEIPDRYMPTLGALAERYKLNKTDVMHQLLAAMFGQGEAFLDNLLDLAGDE
jgi:hypothetical protein